MRLHPLVTLALLAACSPGGQSTTSTPAPAASSGAASDGTCPLEVGTSVLATEINNAGERRDLTLTAGCRYWAETDVRGTTIQLRPRTSGTQLPYIGEVMSGGVQGGTTWEIRANTTGEYQVVVTGAPTGRSVRLTVTVRGSTGTGK